MKRHMREHLNELNHEENQPQYVNLHLAHGLASVVQSDLSHYHQISVIAF